MSKLLFCSLSTENITVMTGEKQLKSSDFSEHEYFVNYTVLRPDYNPTTLMNNIAILVLNQSISMDAYRQPICLPLEGDEFWTLQDANGTDPDVCAVIGWGNGRKGMT